MNAPKRNRARMLTPDGLKKLREQLRSQEMEENSGYKYTLERLGELTGLDPETVKNVLDCKGSDKRTIARCFESFGLVLEDSDHIPATPATAAIADPNFVGREGAIADLNALVSRNAKVIVIQARGGVGKTTLARKYLQQEFGSFLEFPIAKETKDIASIESLIEEKLRQLGEETGREFLVSLDRLKRKLQAERIGILIDNLEPALDSAGKFIEAHRRYVELLRVVSDPTVKSITLITGRERLREADVTVQHYPLRNLDVQAWEQFFQSRSINVDTPALAALHNAYGGNAKAMDLISGAVLEDFSGDVEAYWQANQDDLFIERDLEDLVTKQFDRLQQLDPDAYNLLCRMSCYRYQDVPTVPIEGLFCLLWDVPENRHRRVIKSLQDRSIVDFEGGEFWLHPLIRAEAISRLRIKEDWETANRQAAEFWASSAITIITLEEALKTFESYFHYLAISNFDAACGVIIQRKPSNWEWYNLEGGETVFNANRRLGLSQKTLLAIKQVIKKVTDPYSLGLLYFSLAQCHLITGYLRHGIKECIKAVKLVTDLKRNTESQKPKHNIDFLLERLELASLVTNALCYVNLLEIKTAETILKKVLIEAERTGHENFAIEASFGLAFIYSIQGLSGSSINFADKVVSKIKDKALLSSEWCKGHGFLFLGLTYKNLNEAEKAFEMYRNAVSFAQESGYTQIKAMALTGLAELYRKQKDCQTALFYHSEALKILDGIGAKSDLAESCYQLGLTYKVIDEAEKSNENFQKAIRLFNELEAPKQVERVRQSMQSSQ